MADKKRMSAPPSARSHSSSYNSGKETFGLNVSILAAGAGGMYCGSCMRDNALAGALKRLGHSVTLIPLYTPLRSEQPLVSEPEVFYGGGDGYPPHPARACRGPARRLGGGF